MDKWDKHTLNRVTQSRRFSQTTEPLASLVDNFVRREVVPRQKKLSRLAQAWQELLPEELQKSTCLEKMYHGTLRVLVDNSSSLFELTQIKEELLNQLRQNCPGAAPADIKFIRGMWYRTNEEGIQIPDYKSVKPKKDTNKING